MMKGQREMGLKLAEEFATLGFCCVLDCFFLEHFLSEREKQGGLGNAQEVVMIRMRPCGWWDVWKKDTSFSERGD